MDDRSDGRSGLRRRRSRESALEVLYQMDAQPELLPEAALARYFGAFERDRDGDEAGATAAGGLEPVFVERLVRGVSLHLAEIDARLTAASKNWRLERMSRVDRNLLRLAVFEMQWPDEAGAISARAAIHEAIEIAKRYGAGETPAFVNGVLDRVLNGRGAG